MIVDLFHDCVKAPGLSIEGDIGKTGTRCRHASIQASIEKQLFAHASGVLEAVAEVEFLQTVVVLARDELVEVNLERLLDAWMKIARVPFEPHAHAVHDVCSTHVSEGEHGRDVLVFVGHVIELQISPKFFLRKGQLDGDDLVKREDVVAVKLGIDTAERNHHTQGADNGVRHVQSRGRKVHGRMTYEFLKS